MSEFKASPRANWDKLAEQRKQAAQLILAQTPPKSQPEPKKRVTKDVVAWLSGNTAGKASPMNAKLVKQDTTQKGQCESCVRAAVHYLRKLEGTSWNVAWVGTEDEPRMTEVLRCVGETSLQHLTSRLASNSAKELSQLQAQFRESKEESNRRLKECQVASAARKEAESELEHVQAQLASTKELLSVAEESLRVLREEAQQAKAEAQLTEKHIAEMEKQLLTSSQSNSQMLKALQAMTQSRNEAVAKIENEERSVSADLEAELTALSQEVERLTSTNSALASEIENLKSQVSSANQRSELQYQANKSLHTEITELKTQLSSLTQESELQDRANKALQKEMEELQKLNEELTATNTKCVTEAVNSTQGQDLLHLQVQEAQALSSKLRKELKQAKEAKEGVDAQLHQSQLQNAQLFAQQSTLEKQLERLRSESQACVASVDEKTNKVSQLEREKAEAEKQYKETKSALQSQQGEAAARVSDLTQRLDTLTAAHEQALEKQRAEFSGRVSELTAQLKDFTLKFESQQQLTIEAENDAKSRQADLDSCRQRIIDLEGLLAAVRKSEQDLRSTADELESQKREAQASADEAKKQLEGRRLSFQESQQALQDEVHRLEACLSQAKKENTLLTDQLETAHALDEEIAAMINSPKVSKELLTSLWDVLTTIEGIHHLSVSDDDIVSGVKQARDIIVDTGKQLEAERVEINSLSEKLAQKAAELDAVVKSKWLLEQRTGDRILDLEAANAELSQKTEEQASYYQALEEARAEVLSLETAKEALQQQTLKWNSQWQEAIAAASFASPRTQMSDSSFEQPSPQQVMRVQLDQLLADSKNKCDFITATQRSNAIKNSKIRRLEQEVATLRSQVTPEKLSTVESIIRKSESKHHATPPPPQDDTHLELRYHITSLLQTWMQVEKDGKEELCKKNSAMWKFCAAISSTKSDSTKNTPRGTAFSPVASPRGASKVVSPRAVLSPRSTTRAVAAVLATQEQVDIITQVNVPCPSCSFQDHVDTTCLSALTCRHCALSFSATLCTRCSQGVLVSSKLCGNVRPKCSSCGQR